MSKDSGSITRRQFMIAIAGAGASLSLSCTNNKQNALFGGKKVERDESGKMILIPAGVAALGTGDAEAASISKKYNIHPSWFTSEKSRQARMKSFYIDEFPVTNADFLKFADATNLKGEPANYCRAQIKEKGDHPVLFANAHVASDYAKWAGKRLATEDEWEYAARGEEGLIYPWGNKWDASRCNNNAKNLPLGWNTSAVDKYRHGVSPFGVMDMAGNVCEWIATMHGESNVVKGGFYLQSEPYRFRSACRLASQLGGNNQEYIGFRCAKDIG